MNNEPEIYEWKDEYNIGVKVVDDAHKRLFTIVSRILRNFTERDFEKNKTTCIEAVKYLKDYSLQHFIQEEAYMRSIDYYGLNAHKQVHDNMRDVVIPTLARELEVSCYSKESLEHFVGACAGWLTAHILIEDQAIAGKAQSKWVNFGGEGMDKLEKIIIEVVKSAFRFNTSIASRNYTGHKLGSIFCCHEVFRGRGGIEYVITSAIERPILEKALANLMNENASKMEHVVKPMVSEMVLSLNKTVADSFVGETLNCLSSDFIESKDFYKIFEKVYPDHSTLWRTDSGYFVFCFSRKPDIL